MKCALKTMGHLFEIQGVVRNRRAGFKQIEKGGVVGLIRLMSLKQNAMLSLPDLIVNAYVGI